MTHWCRSASPRRAGGPPIVIWGAGGHARVVASTVSLMGEFDVVGFLDNTSPQLGGQDFCGRTILGGDEQLDRLRADGVRFAFVAVGDNVARLRLAALLEERGFRLPTIVHPQAVVYDDVILGDGTFVAAGAVIAANSTISRCGIVNHLASVDHDCTLDDGVHVSPGARLAGRVRVGRATWIGLNASVREKLTVGSAVVVAAGAVVIRDVTDGLVVGGVPARVLRGAATASEAQVDRIADVGEPTVVAAAGTGIDRTTTVDTIPMVVVTPRSSAPLALLGGRPSFQEKLYVGRPNVPTVSKLFDRIESALERRWLTNDGPLVRELEQRLAESLGGAEVVAVSNATLGLQLAARALNLTGEVLLPAMTFIATAHALEWEGLTPVFCDVDMQTHNIDPDDVLRRITERTSAIVGVHLWGRPCAVERLTEIARDRGLKLIFDAAHAFGCSHQGKMIGQFGDAEIFSFHATKFVNTLEGGAIATTHRETAASVRLLRNFGFAGVDRVAQLGINAKMNEFSAAMGLACLDDLDVFLDTNETNHGEYRRVFAGLPGIRINEPPPAERQNFQYVVAEINPHVCPLSRDELAQVLWAENCIVRRYFYPGCHNAPPYVMRQLCLLPNTDRLCNRVLVFPTGTAVSHDDIHRIGALVRDALNHRQAVRERIRHLDRAAA
jgi:sugar O-acyltransferase (sialic acid O-acetyltransferase NeuD family)